MAMYRVEPTQRDTVSVFSAAREPVVTAEPGDVIGGRCAVDNGVAPPPGEPGRGDV